MSRFHRAAPCLAALAVIALAACAREGSRGTYSEAPQPAMTMAAAYVDTTLDYPRLRYEDGAVSLNDRCPVRRAALNPKLPPMLVNGHPVGFC